MNKDNEAQIKSLQRRLFTIHNRSSYCIVSVFRNFPTFSVTDIAKRDRKYYDCQLTVRIAPASNYSKQINIVPIVNISVRFVRQIIE